MTWYFLEFIVSWATFFPVHGIKLGQPYGLIKLPHAANNHFFDTFNQARYPFRSICYFHRSWIFRVVRSWSFLPNTEMTRATRKPMADIMICWMHRPSNIVQEDKFQLIQSPYIQKKGLQQICVWRGSRALLVHSLGHGLPGATGDLEHYELRKVTFFLGSFTTEASLNYWFSSWVLLVYAGKDPISDLQEEVCLDSDNWAKVLFIFKARRENKGRVSC